MNKMFLGVRMMNFAINLRNLIKKLSDQTFSN